MHLYYLKLIWNIYIVFSIVFYFHNFFLIFATLSAPMPGWAEGGQRNI